MSGKSPQVRLVERLLRERGIGRHTLFLTQREGTILPNGLEALSGFVLDAKGRVHNFWLAWDEERAEPALNPFYLVENPEEELADDEEYDRALRIMRLY